MRDHPSHETDEFGAWSEQPGRRGDARGPRVRSQIGFWLGLALVAGLALLLLGMGIEAAAFETANAGRYSETGALIGRGR